MAKPPIRPNSLLLIPAGSAPSRLNCLNPSSPTSPAVRLQVAPPPKLPCLDEDHIQLPARYKPKRKSIFATYLETDIIVSLEDRDSDNKLIAEDAEDNTLIAEDTNGNKLIVVVEDTEDQITYKSRDHPENLKQDRHTDMETALKWIKQEILLMKQQDRHLMRQLLDLRATIHQLRGIRSCHSSGSDLTSMGGSWNSLEDGSLSAPCMESPRNEKDILNSFQTRTVSMMSVLPSPSPAKMRRHIPKGNSFEVITLH